MKKLLCTLLAAALIFSMFAGCGGNEVISASEKADSASAAETIVPAENVPDEETMAPVENELESVSELAEEPEPENQISYPLGQEGETITFWTTIPGNQTRCV